MNHFEVYLMVTSREMDGSQLGFFFFSQKKNLICEFNVNNVGFSLVYMCPEVPIFNVRVFTND